VEDKRKEEIYSKKVKAGRRTYYFDVKENVKNDVYLIISETKSVEFGKQDRFRIMVFPEDIDNFQEAFNEVIHFIKGKISHHGGKTNNEDKY